MAEPETSLGIVDSFPSHIAHLDEDDVERWYEILYESSLFFRVPVVPFIKSITYQDGQYKVETEKVDNIFDGNLDTLTPNAFAKFAKACELYHIDGKLGYVNGEVVVIPTEFYTDDHSSHIWPLAYKFHSDLESVEVSRWTNKIQCSSTGVTARKFIPRIFTEQSFHLESPERFSHDDVVFVNSKLSNENNYVVKVESPGGSTEIWKSPVPGTILRTRANDIELELKLLQKGLIREIRFTYQDSVMGLMDFENKDCDGDPTYIGETPVLVLLPITIEPFVEGITLKEIDKDLVIKNFDTIVASFIKEIEALQARGIEHRDTHWGNVIIRPDFTVSIIDFDVAKIDGYGKAILEHVNETPPGYKYSADLNIFLCSLYLKLHGAIPRYTSEYIPVSFEEMMRNRMRPKYKLNHSTAFIPVPGLSPEQNAYLREHT